MTRQSQVSLHSLVSWIAVAVLTGCGSKAASTTCAEIAGTPWSPNIASAADTNHRETGSISVSTQSATGVITGLGQAAPATREVSFTIDMSQDLGANGALSLEADITSYPSGLAGSAFPVLVSLSDGTREWLQLARSGAAGDCVASGYFSCSGGTCAENSGCSVGSNGAYLDRDQWLQHQVGPFGFSSVNTFPTCNWATGSPACAFNSVPLFSGGKLPTGTYTAKYILLASNYATLDGYQATVRLTVVKKIDATASSTSANGALDLNVVIVGDEGVAASRTEAGKRNLDALMTAVQAHYNQSGTGVRLGTVRAVEWKCADDGNDYTDPGFNDLGSIFSAGSKLLTEIGTGNGQKPAVNLYLVNTIPYTTANVVVQGAAGAIGGPVRNATEASGVAVALEVGVDQYNSACTTTPCPAELQDESFLNLTDTFSHELGHYLGLNHLSERDGVLRDGVPDSPECNSVVISGSSQVTHTSCLSTAACAAACSGYNGSTAFCAAASECEFNHIMWWTSKNFSSPGGLGDGALFSADSSKVLLASPFIW